MHLFRSLVLTAGFVLWAIPGLGDSPALSMADIAAVKAANQAYVAAWLANDPEAVMSALTRDAVLIPHHGVEPVIGAAAIRDFWFPPDSPPARVTHMVNTVTEIQVSGDIAIVWGRSELEFVFGETTFRNSGNYLSVLKKGEDGQWRLARRIWNDPVAVEN